MIQRLQQRTGSGDQQRPLRLKHKGQQGNLNSMRSETEAGSHPALQVIRSILDFVLIGMRSNWRGSCAGGLLSAWSLYKFSLAAV